MSNLEHIIENTLHLFQDRTKEDIITAITKDVNYKHQSLNAETICEICQYIWCTYLDYGHRLIDDKTNIAHWILNDYNMCSCSKCNTWFDEPMSDENYCPMCEKRIETFVADKEE